MGGFSEQFRAVKFAVGADHGEASTLTEMRSCTTMAKPRISEFYGISIYMYYRDHDPPHFHAIYGEFEALVEIESTRVVDGELPRRAYALVIDWAVMHCDQLRENWDLARNSQPLNRIDPLV